jgi:peptide/nickel transport system permease protein
MADSIPASASAEAAPALGGQIRRSEAWQRLSRQLLGTVPGIAGLSLTTTVLLVALLAPLLAPADPFAIVGPPLSAPTAEHPLGTDALGRDLLSGVIHGARTSVVVVGWTGVLVVVIGVAVGTVSGYVGGRLDDALMRATEFFQVLPRFFLAIVVLALWGPGIDRLIVVLGLTSWAMLARVVRSEVLSLRHRPFVEAAICSGASDPRVAVREILPHALPATIAYLGLILAQVLLLEASLGFLGLGDPNVMSWGYLAGQAQRYLRVAWWLSVFPGVAIVLAVLGLNLLGDAFTDALGGKERGKGRSRGPRR